MVRNFLKNYVYPVATLSGSIIGVGFLSLPYIAAQVGLLPMLFYFAIVFAIILMIHIMFAKTSLATPDFKRFPGFVGYYLGKWPEWLILFTNTLGMFGILLIYIIVGGEFLTTVLSPFFGGNVFFYTLLYFTAGSLLILFGVKLISRVEVWTLGLLVIAFVVIFCEGLPHISLANLFVQNTPPSIDNFFLPFGAIMFSLWGTGLIPEVEEMLRRKPYTARHLSEGKKHFIGIVITSLVIPALVYLAFMIMIVGITGKNTTESALIGLSNLLGLNLAAVALCMGIVATFNCFISQGLLLKKIFMYDMKIPEFAAWGFTCSVPLILFLLGLHSFIPLISFIGSVLLSIEGVLILLMYLKIRKRK